MRIDSAPADAASAPPPHPRLRRIVRELVHAAAKGDHIVTAARAKTADLPGRRVRLSAAFRQLGDTWHELYNAARTTPADIVPATPLTPVGTTARSASAAAPTSTPSDPVGALVLASQALTPSRSGSVQQQQLQMLVRGFAGAVQGLRDHQGAQDARLNSFELVQQQQSGLMAAIHEELVAARRACETNASRLSRPPLRGPRSPSSPRRAAADRSGPVRLAVASPSTASGGTRARRVLSTDNPPAPSQPLHLSSSFEDDSNELPPSTSR
ncbi:hypothetical protein RJ55_01257 [Drechmeria coniospora]|nr:hypothetical protein RJ55_01257 [Drechmeria coniospora]